MIRQWFAVACMISLMFSVALVGLAIESYRRDITHRFHDRKGDLWEASIRRGVFTVENEYAMRVRELNASWIEMASREQRANQLRAEWQRRPNRFEKQKDDLVDRLAAADRQVYESNDRCTVVQLAMDQLERSGSPPPVTHSVHWIPLGLATSALPACWPLWALIVRIRGARRRRSGRCAACGYDVRANTMRCPECGTTILARASA